MLCSSSKKTSRKWLVQRLILFTIIFSVFYSVIVYIYATVGKSMVGMDDPFNQYWPVFVYQWRMVKEGSFGKLFDFAIGLGEDRHTAFYYYGLYNPLHYISLFFSKNNLLIAWNVVLGMKLFLGGIAFILFANSRGKKSLFVVVGALLYVFNNYLLCYGMYFYTFYDICYTLPLMIIGVNEIIEGRKSFSVWLVLSIVWQGLNGFYFLYMQSIIVAVYVIIRTVWQLYNAYKEKRKYSKVLLVNEDEDSNITKIGDGGNIDTSILFKRLLQIIICCLVSICVMAPLLLPGAYSLIHSGRSAASMPYVWQDFLPSIEIIQLFVLFFLAPHGALVSFWPIITLIGLAGLLLTWKRHRFLSVLVIVCSIGVTIPAMGGILNGLSYIIDRGSVYIFLVYAYAAVIGLEEFTYSNWSETKKIINKDIITISVIVLYIIAQLVITSIPERRYYYLLLIIFVVAFAIIFFWKNITYKQGKNIKDTLVFSLCIVVLFLHTIMMFTKLPIVGGLNTTQYYRESQELRNYSFGDKYSKYVSTIKDDSFFRCDFQYADSLNSGSLLNYYGTGEYLSIGTEGISELHKQLGLGGIQYGLRGWKVLEDLYSVKYYENNEGNIICNDDQLPLGIFYKDAVYESDVEDFNGLNKMALLLDKVILCEDADDGLSVSKTENRKSDSNIKNKLVAMQCVLSGADLDNGIIIKEDIANQEITRTVINAPEDSELQVLLDTNQKIGEGEFFLEFVNGESEGWHFMKVNGNPVVRYEGTHPRYIKIDNPLENEVIITFEREIQLTCDEVMVWYYPDDLYRKAIEQRNGETDVTTTVGIDEIVCDVNAIKDGYVLFAIPYSEGWTATVDGEKTKLSKADYNLMVVPINKGKHKILLKYHRSWQLAGWIVGIVGCIIFISKVMDNKYGKKLISERIKINEQNRNFV